MNSRLVKFFLGFAFSLAVNIVIFAVAAFSAKPAQAESLQITFEGLQGLLEAKNTKLEAAKLEVEAAAKREGYLHRSFLPSLEIYGKQESFKLGSASQKSSPGYGAELKLNFFNGGRDRVEAEVRALTKEKKGYQYKRMLSEELAKARIHFWEILALQEKIELLENALSINAEILKSAEKRIRSGVATESDRMEFQMKAVDLGRKLSEAKLNLQSQKGEIAVLLQLDSIKDLNFPQKLAHQHDFEQLLKHTAKDHDFLTKEMELQSKATKLSADSQSRSWWPRLDAFAMLNQWNEREKDGPSASDRLETVVGLKVSMNFSAGLEARNEAAALAKEAAGFEKLAHQQRRELEIHLQNELSELRLRHDQIHESEENILRAEKYYKITQSEYSRGVKNSPDVLGASEKLFDTKLMRIETIRDFQIAKAHVLQKAPPNISGLGAASN